MRSRCVAGKWSRFVAGDFNGFGFSADSATFVRAARRCGQRKKLISCRIFHTSYLWVFEPHDIATWNARLILLRCLSNFTKADVHVEKPQILLTHACNLSHCDFMHKPWILYHRVKDLRKALLLNSIHLTVPLQPRAAVCLQFESEHNSLFQK